MESSFLGISAIIAGTVQLSTELGSYFIRNDLLPQVSFFSSMANDSMNLYREYMNHDPSFKKDLLCTLFLHYTSVLTSFLPQPVRIFLFI